MRYYGDIQLKRDKSKLVGESVLTVEDLNTFQIPIIQKPSSDGNLIPTENPAIYLANFLGAAAQSAAVLNNTNHIKLDIENEISFFMQKVADWTTGSGTSAERGVSYVFSVWNLPEGVIPISIRYTGYRGGIPNTSNPTNMFKTGRNSRVPVFPGYSGTISNITLSSNTVSNTNNALNSIFEAAKNLFKFSDNWSSGLTGTATPTAANIKIQTDLLLNTLIRITGIIIPTLTAAPAGTSQSQVQTALNNVVTAINTAIAGNRDDYCIVSTGTLNTDGQIGHSTAAAVNGALRTFNGTGTPTTTVAERDDLTRGTTIILDITKDYLAENGLPKRFEIIIQFTESLVENILISIRKLS